jgi:hypothetical protein
MLVRPADLPRRIELTGAGGRDSEEKRKAESGERK